MHREPMNHTMWRLRAVVACGALGLLMSCDDSGGDGETSVDTGDAAPVVCDNGEPSVGGLCPVCDETCADWSLDDYVYVPPGAAWVLATRADIIEYFNSGQTGEAPDDSRFQRLELSGFWIQRDEASLADYTACVAAGGCEFPEYDLLTDDDDDVNVTQERLSAATGERRDGRCPVAVGWEGDWESYSFRGEFQITFWGQPNEGDAARDFIDVKDAYNFCFEHEARLPRTEEWVRALFSDSREVWPKSASTSRICPDINTEPSPSSTVMGCGASEITLSSSECEGDISEFGVRGMIGNVMEPVVGDFDGYVMQAANACKSGAGILAGPHWDSDMLPILGAVLGYRAGERVDEYAMALRTLRFPTLETTVGVRCVRPCCRYPGE